MTRKQLSIGLFACAIFIVAYFLFSPDRLANDSQKINYAIGYQLGKRFQSLKIKIDLKIFSTAFADGFENKPSQLNENDLNAMAEGLPSETREMARQLLASPWINTGAPLQKELETGSSPNRPNPNKAHK